jgi:hypothetical protein
MPAGMGSFDFVRLAPHCAQDDSVILPTLFLSDIIFLSAVFLRHVIS